MIKKNLLIVNIVIACLFVLSLSLYRLNPFHFLLYFLLFFFPPIGLLTIPLGVAGIITSIRHRFKDKLDWFNFVVGIILILLPGIVYFIFRDVDIIN